MKKINTDILCIVMIFFLSLCVVKHATARPAGTSKPSDNGHFAVLRSKMIQEQLQRRGIKNRQVLDAFRNVGRHQFVPKRYHLLAYADRPLPIGEGQTISQPYIVAYMTEALELTKTDRVLEVGTGSGYQAAILAEICDTVYSIEVIKSLGNRAAELLSRLGHKNVFVKIGDGYKGWKEHAPFDAIIVTCAPSKIPEPLTRQLAEGGRMIIPVGDKYVQELVLLQKINNRLVEKSVLPVLFVPMVDPDGKKY
jgi:protein-L-isoaspartate(D-aspartate) O-methyltransferase